MIKIIALEGCPYTSRILEMTKNYKREIYIVPQNQKHLYNKGEMKTFPQVYYDDKLIGGYTEFSKLCEIKNTICELDLGLNFISDILNFLLH